MKTHTRAALQAHTSLTAARPPLEFKGANDDDGPDVLDEIKAAVDKVADAAKAREDALTKRLDAIEAKGNRASLGMGGEDSNPEAAAEERKALATFIRTGDETDLKAMSVGSDPDGGYLVSPVRSSGMQKRIRDLSPLRRLARVETITTGDAFEEPLDLGESGATWVGETAARPATTTPQLGMMRIPVHEIYALQTVTQRLLDDAGFDLGGWVDGKIAEKFARSEGEAFAAGDGIGKPRGLLDYTVVSTDDATRAWGQFQYFATGTADNLTPANPADLPGAGPADVLRDVVWGLKAPYRANANWLMNSATANRLDKLKDGNGDYIWRAGMTAGAPPSLLGYAVEIDEQFPDIGAGALPIAFGDLKQAYVIVEKVGIRSLRDPYTSKPNVLFYAYRRIGGGAGNTEALKFVKIAAS